MEEIRQQGYIEKIAALLNNIKETPFEGLGKPEELKYTWAGFWSRQITKEHRLVYRVEGELIIVYSLRGHNE